MDRLSPDASERIPKNIAASEQITRPSLTFFQDAWRRLKQNKLAMVSLVFLILMVLVAIIGPMIFTDYTSTNSDALNAPPSSEHWFGTDTLGRDLFARVLRGSRVSLTVGVVVTLIDVLIGLIYGGISGYKGGAVDNAMMRVVDVLITIPELIILILLLSIFPSGMGTLILGLSLTGWTGFARLVRGQVLQIRESEYVLASRVLGAKSGFILFRHLIPNILGPMIVRLTMYIPSVIFYEAFLSFIGLGIKPPEPSWGNLAQNGASAFPNYLWIFVFPAIFMSLTMLAFNILGDGLRDSLDPRMRQ